MSETTLKRIVIFVAILVFGYGLVAIVRSGLESDGDGEAGDTELGRVLSELEVESVEEVLLVDEGDTVRLAREDRGWTVDGYRADSARVARFWRSLAKQDVGNPVARNPANHSRLGVAEEQASSLVLRTADGEEHVILLGDSGPTYPSVYVRTAGADEVHLLESSLAVSAGQSVTTWRDHTIARVDTSRVAMVEVMMPDDAYTLRRIGGGGDTGGGDADDAGAGAAGGQGSGWTVDDEPATAAQARNLLGGLSRVLASDFYEVEGAWPESVAGEDAEVRRIVALASESDTLAALTIRGDAETGYAVRTADDSTVYEIASFDIGRLFPPRESLRGGGEAPGSGAD